ncbi:ETX/MTX2 family pore-forming toxin [Spiroplasma endosymbiont of Virgichneumon dumeticola]|uniref:ETX/MTX2 family pore-forming toxin n=1 Tax=Spiroplasma endosymbiont of Virgichneumon dumeticola TaxID=3139323 RepID=UPI0035C89CCC
MKEFTHIYNENSVININDYIQGAFVYAEDIKCYSGWKIDKIEDVKLSNLKTTDAVGETIGDPEIISQDKTFEYVGENILKNYNDLEQNIATMSFTKKIGETVSASITQGIKVSEETDILVDKTNVKVSLSGTIAEQHSETKEYTVPAQTIKVPPHSQVKVTVYWSQVQIIQKVKTSCKLSGTVTGKCYSSELTAVVVVIISVLIIEFNLDFKLILLLSFLLFLLVNYHAFFSKFFNIVNRKPCY